MTILLIVSGTFNLVKAQNVQEQMMKAHPSCNDVFLNAMDILPKFYRENQIDSLRKAIGIWENACGDIPQIRITNILLSMEEKTFRVGALDSSVITLMEEYAERFNNYSKYPNSYSDAQNRFYKFASAWAGLLLGQKNLDSNETFICKVLTGEMAAPVKEIKGSSAAYPELAALVGHNETAERDAVRINLTFSTGVWIPTGNLSLLGVKPSVGFQVGVRNRHHQVDFTTQIRFINSEESYIVKRNNELIERWNYLGWYIGLDYNYYFVSAKKVDFGIVAGIGYDGFDITGSTYYYDYYYAYDYLSPHSIGSFNANGGLRFNYYVGPRFYLGLQGRYNWINYGNPGGTNMNGDGYSIDLIFGFNHKDSYSMH